MTTTVTVGPSTTQLAASSIVPPEYVPRDVRSWAAVNGWPQVAGGRGRLPAAAIEAYAEHRQRGPAELVPGSSSTSETPGAAVAGHVPPLTSSPEEERAESVGDLHLA